MKKTILAFTMVVSVSAAWGLEWIDVPAVTSAKPAVIAAQAPVPNPDLLERLFKTDDEIVRVQTLLGHYVIGKTISGPVLIPNPVEILIGGEFRDVLNLFPFLRSVAVDGRIKVHLGGGNIAAEYGRIRAEFMARLPRLILLEKATGLGTDLSRGHMIWARGLQIVSQPECVGIVGRSPWPDYCS